MQEKGLRKSRNILRFSLMAVALLGGIYGLFSCNSQEAKPESNEVQTEEKSDVQKSDTLPQGDMKVAGDTATLDQTKKDETDINPATNNNTPKQQDKLNGNAAVGGKVKKMSQNQLKQQDALDKDVAVSVKDVEGVQERNVVATRDNEPETSLVEKSESNNDREMQLPSFAHGNLYAWLNQNILYPSEAIKNNIQGNVVLSFIVGTDGSISDVEVVKGVDPLLDEEAARVIKSMPKWIPGKLNGEYVRTKISLTVSFNHL